MLCRQSGIATVIERRLQLRQLDTPDILHPAGLGRRIVHGSDVMR
jgi:hypothetical protein